MPHFFLVSIKCPRKARTVAEPFVSERPFVPISRLKRTTFFTSFFLRVNVAVIAEWRSAITSTALRVLGRLLIIARGRPSSRIVSRFLARSPERVIRPRCLCRRPPLFGRRGNLFASLFYTSRSRIDRELGQRTPPQPEKER